MLKWLFGKSKTAHSEDHVWMTNAARLRGLKAKVSEHRTAGQCVLVVTHTHSAFDEVASVIADAGHLHCRDIFEQDNVRRTIREGKGTALTLASALPKDATKPSERSIELLVYGRGNSTSEDNAIMLFASPLDARVAFHMSMEDPLLSEHAESVRPLLEKLGMTEDEPIVHSFVSRAIARAQEKRGR